MGKIDPTARIEDGAVIGDDVNLASRIESYSLRGQVLASETTFARASTFVSASEAQSVRIKGKQEPILVREVYGIPSHDKTVPRREFRKSPRVKVSVPFSYQVIEGDVLSPQVMQGTVLDIGYFGILAELERPVAQLTDLKLEIGLAPVGLHVADAYGKGRGCATRIPTDAEMDRVNQRLAAARGTRGKRCSFACHSCCRPIVASSTPKAPTSPVTAAHPNSGGMLGWRCWT